MEFDLGMQIPGLSESQTHRIVGVGRHLGRSPRPAPCSEQGQVARGCVEPGFAHPWGWDPTACSSGQSPSQDSFTGYRRDTTEWQKWQRLYRRLLAQTQWKPARSAIPTGSPFPHSSRVDGKDFTTFGAGAGGLLFASVSWLPDPQLCSRQGGYHTDIFHSLLPSWERTSKPSPSQQPSSCKAILAPVSLSWCQRSCLGAVSACSFSIKCATPTRLCRIAVSPELWRHRKVSSALATHGSIACT